MSAIKGLSPNRRRCTNEKPIRGKPVRCSYTCLAGRDHCSLHWPAGDGPPVEAATPKPAPMQYSGRESKGWRQEPAVHVPVKAVAGAKDRKIPGLNVPTAKPEARPVPTNGDIKW